MLKAFYRYASVALLIVGLKRWAMKALMSPIEIEDIKIPIIHMQNTPFKVELPRPPFKFEVVFEDKIASAQLGDIKTNVIKIPHNLLDVN